MKHTKLHVWGFAVALGFTWALALFVAGILSSLSGYCIDFVHALGTFYIGYAPGFVGAILGAIWGFCDLFIGGLIVAFIYNLFVRSKAD